MQSNGLKDTSLRRKKIFQGTVSSQKSWRDGYDKDMWRESIGP
jgi:hypothetical protein